MIEHLTIPVRDRRIGGIYLCVGLMFDYAIGKAVRCANGDFGGDFV